MRKFNLLEQVPSIRNTLRPDGTYHGIEKRSKTVPLFALFFIAAIAFAGLNYKNELLDIAGSNKKPAPAMTANEPIPNPEAAPGMAAPSATAEEETEDTSKTEETTPPEQILSRPVAMDAEAPVKRASKTDGSWRIRFALCLYRKSCDGAVSQLKAKGVESFVAESRAELVFYKVVIGPWPVVSQAKEVADKLTAKGVEAEPFSANERYYVGAMSLTTAKAQADVVKIASGLGYKAEKGGPKKEIRGVFKVYKKDSFAGRDEAEKAALALRGRQISCFVEKEG